MNLKIIKCGTNVRAGNIAGKITAAVIRFDKVQYEFSYWDNDMRYQQIWLHRDEFVVDETEKTNIGFKQTIKQV
jgi:hypothetical protein